MSSEDKIEIPKEFEENVKKFVVIDDLIKKKQKEMTELKNQKKPCEEFIINCLDQMDETVIEIGDGKIKKNKLETKAPLNTEIIKEAISQKIDNPSVVEDIMNLMQELRPIKTRTNLKRTQKRGRKKKK